MICPLTLLTCVGGFCGGSKDGNRCPLAPPYSNPLAGTGFADVGTLYAGPAGPSCNALVLAQLTQEGALARAGIDPGLEILGGLAVRILGFEARLRTGTAWFGWPTERVSQDEAAGIRQADELAAAMARNWAIQAADRARDAELQREREERRRAEAERQRELAERRRHQAEEAERRLREGEVTLGERVGWRMWWADRGGLRSFYTAHRWRPGMVMNGQPKRDGYEGVWAFAERQRAIEKAWQASPDVMIRPQSGPAQAVWGAVALWGDVFEHQDGWRGEHARIVSLDGIHLPRPRTRRSGQLAFYRKYRAMLEGLRERYGVGSFRDYQIAQRRGNPADF